MDTWHTHLYQDLANLLIETLNNQADQRDESANAFGYAAVAAEACGRHVQARQLYDAARHSRVEAIKLRTFARAAQHQEGRT
jgi:hypothetical protein